MFDGKSHTFECVKIAITADFFVYRRFDPILWTELNTINNYRHVQPAARKKLNIWHFTRPRRPNRVRHVNFTKRRDSARKIYSLTKHAILFSRFLSYTYIYYVAAEILKIILRPGCSLSLRMRSYGLYALCTPNNM